MHPVPVPLTGRDARQVVGSTGRTLARTLQSAVFPNVQGTPSVGAIAAKARALDLANSAWFRNVALRIVAGASAMAPAVAPRTVTETASNRVFILMFL